MHSAKVDMQPNNTLNKQTSAWENFNIRQKLGLFDLHSSANINKVELFHVLGPRHLRHDKVECTLCILIQGDILSIIEQEIDCKD